MEFVSVDIAKLASEIFTQLQAGIPSRRLHLEIGALPPAWGDRDMIHQVILNLLSNAIKFSPCDGEARIEIGGTAEELENRYYVKDYGVGFDMRYAEKLFRVFERVHPTGQYEGSGIGLAIVKRIVERHGGRVWAEGIVGTGATIYFALPVKEKKHE
jgi:light-regulated signal transduction histidine kinase (bacteriophytochrome)